MVGRSPLRVAVDQGYKGHRLTGHPHTAVYITGQRRGVTDKIKRWLKRRAVVEPVIGHAKNDGLLGRNWLKGRTGDRCNALLAAAGFNLRRLLRFLRGITYFLRNFFCAILAALRPTTTLAVYTGFQYDFLTADWIFALPFRLSSILAPQRRLSVCDL